MITLAITYTSFVSAFDEYNHTINPGRGPMCVHKNLNTGLEEKYAYLYENFNNNNFYCPDFDPTNAQVLTGSERSKVNYDVAPSTYFTPSPSPQVIETMDPKTGRTGYTILYIPVANLLHPNSHTCKLGTIND